jgi:putative endonuclease
MNIMKLGEKGEGHAAKFLKKKGYKLLEQNFKTAIGEIDIIAQDGETLVFIEVKTRESLMYGQPFEAVNFAKKRKIGNVALLYLKRFKELPPCRFDVVSIYYEGKKPECELIQDAFEV